jgi:hypothetical protein
MFIPEVLHEVCGCSEAVEDAQGEPLPPSAASASPFQRAVRRRVPKRQIQNTGAGWLWWGSSLTWVTKAAVGSLPSQLLVACMVAHAKQRRQVNRLLISWLRASFDRSAASPPRSSLSGQAAPCLLRLVCLSVPPCRACAEPRVHA